MKNVMKRAWEIARNAVKRFGYTAKSYIKMALVMAWKEYKGMKNQVVKPICERIEELEELGFKRWQKGQFDRLYINADKLGLECRYYKTGNIKSAWFGGEEISNSEGYRMKAAKTYIDVATGEVISTNSTLRKAAMELAGINE